MSPEQCQGAGGVDEKTDAYSLGCVLYEALAGRPPFVAEGVLQILGKHVLQNPEPLARLAPKAPSAVCDLVHRLLIKDKAKRPSISDAADELGVLLSKLSGGSSVVRSRLPDPDFSHAIPASQFGTTIGSSIGEKTPLFSARSRLLITTGAGLTVAGAALLSVLLLRSGQKPAPPSSAFQRQKSLPAAAAPSSQPLPAKAGPATPGVLPVATEVLAASPPGSTPQSNKASAQPVSAKPAAQPSSSRPAAESKAERPKRPAKAGSPSIPPSKTAKPKAFGYEE